MHLPGLADVVDKNYVGCRFPAFQNRASRGFDDYAIHSGLR
jgi:hypothetical protein